MQLEGKIMTVHTFLTSSISVSLLIFMSEVFAQDIVTDFDGNEYHSIVIGDQIWLQENIKALHYSDGTAIPDVVSYDNNESNANIYGRLYTWDAAMDGMTSEGARGICPTGWHIPSAAEWNTLENYLGGSSIAGGKMKEIGISHWRRFNVGADNSSAFTALPGGEYDAHDSPHQFRLINDYAVFWTSTEISATFANERYLAFDAAASISFNWYKIMKYSIRAIQDSEVSDLINEEIQFPKRSLLYPNVPNPFNPSTIITYEISKTDIVNVDIIDIRGKLMKSLQCEQVSAGVHELIWHGMNASGQQVDSGIYVVVMSVGTQIQTQKISLIR